MRALSAKAESDGIYQTINSMGSCMRFDCLNRNKKCDDCLHFSLYEVYVLDTNGRPTGKTKRGKI